MHTLGAGKTAVSHYDCLCKAGEMGTTRHVAAKKETTTKKFKIEVGCPSSFFAECGVHHIVGYKHQQPYLKRCAGSPFDARCRELLTLRLGSEMVSEGPLSVPDGAMCSAAKLQQA